MRSVSENPPLPQAFPTGTFESLVQFTSQTNQQLRSVFREMGYRINRTLPKDGSERMGAPLPLTSVTVASLPPAADWLGALVWASDVPALRVSNGTSWVPVTDGFLETGTFTPTLTFATPGTLSVAYTAQTGVYRKLGDLVYVEFHVEGSITKGTASGDFRVGGLPFAALGSRAALVISFLTGANVAYPAGRSWWTAEVRGAASDATIYGHGSAAQSAPLTVSNVTNGTTGLYMSGTYVAT